MGKDLKDETIVLQLEGVFQDAYFASKIHATFFQPNYAEIIPGILEKSKPKFELLNKFYGEKDFALGYLTLIDFLAAEYGYWLEKIAPEYFASFPFFKRTR